MGKAMNFIGYQCAWLACVVGARAGRAWLALPVVIAVVGRHVARASESWRELTVVLIVGGVGALWLSFATTLNVSLRWLRGRPLETALLGAIARRFDGTAPLAFAPRDASKVGGHV